MALHVSCSCFLVCLLLSLARLGVLTGFLFGLPPQEERPSAPGSTVCSRHAPQTIAPPVVSPPLPRRMWGQRLSVRPWSEVKSRRGAPNRIDTEGFACPNQQCAYCGIADAQFHALVGDGKHGRAERIQTFRCQACHTTFTARRHTPLYRLKTPSHQIGMVLSALAEGLDPSAAERVAATDRPPSPPGSPVRASTRRSCTSAPSAICSLPHLQLDELRTRLRCANQVLWLWLAIDPFTKILPVLQLGPRTQNMAHTVHPLPATDPGSWLPPALHQ